MKRITAALILTAIFTFCFATNVAFAETPYDIGEPPLAVEEALLSPPLPGDNYEDEFVVHWYSPAEEDTTRIPSGPTLEVIDDNFEDPQAPELVDDSEESTTNPAMAPQPHMGYLKTSEDFHPWEYVKALLKQGAQKNVSFVRDNGNVYIRINVYLPIPEEYPKGLEYDGCYYVVVKNGIMYYLSPTSIGWQRQIF